MRKLFVALGALMLLAGGVAVAQNTAFMGALTLTPIPVGPSAIPVLTPGPQSTVISLSGGTFVCTGGGTITVANANVDAGSVVMFGLKTLGGTPLAPAMGTVTPGTGFVAKCGGSDTSTYNYVVFG